MGFYLVINNTILISHTVFGDGLVFPAIRLQMLLSVPQDTMAHMLTDTELVTLHTPCALSVMCVCVFVSDNETLETSRNRHTNNNLHN